MNSARQRVRRAVESALADIDVDDVVIVAVSGGPDSVALAQGVIDAGRRGHAVIVDHGLQADSATVAESAARLCREIGMADVTVVRVDVPTGPGQGGLEAAARGARRAALETAAADAGAVAILLGHTRDDQAETVLLRLARGSGARSLAAMAPVAGLWRRPLLSLPRDVVRAAIDGYTPWDDPHNDDERFARVRVRRTALPALGEALGPDVVDGLVRTAAQLRDDADALDAWAQVARGEAEVGGAEVGVAGLDVERLGQLPRAVRTRILRAAALDAGCPAGQLTAEHIDRVDELITRWHGQGAIDLPGGVAGERSCGRLSFTRIAPVAERRIARKET